LAAPFESAKQGVFRDGEDYYTTMKVATKNWQKNPDFQGRNEFFSRGRLTAISSPNRISIVIDWRTCAVRESCSEITP
jgi:hypothetical protein